MSAPTEGAQDDRLLHELAERLRADGAQRPLVVTGPSRRFLGRVTRALQGFEVAVFAGAEVHVPQECVEAAASAVQAHNADAVIAVGGGSAIGLGKALRLGGGPSYYAVPTTYAGSEYTTVWGISRGGRKHTGRDPSVAPRAVFAEPRLLLELPHAQAVASLTNALAHPISALTVEPAVDAEAERDLVAAAASAFEALEGLLAAPEEASAHGRAAAVVARAARALEAGGLGEHHKAVHALARPGTPHAALHAALLPQTWAHHRAHPGLRKLAQRLPGIDGPTALFDLLRRAGVATALGSVGVTSDVLDEAIRALGLQSRPWLEAAYLGAWPHLRFSEYRVDEVPCVHWGCDPERARLIVIALHGRGVAAHAIAQRGYEIFGDRDDVCVLAPIKRERSWYPEPYQAPLEAQGDALPGAVDRVARCVAWAQGVDSTPPGIAPEIAVLGFSQGACLACHCALSGAIAPDHLWIAAGAAMGEGGPEPRVDLRGVRAVVSGTTDDPFVAIATVRPTIEALRAAGARVDTHLATGAEHEISYRFRVAVRRAAGLESAAPQGFGNHLQVELLPGVLPERQLSPRRPAHGLYVEQLNTVPFTVPRQHNPRVWMYRVRSATEHSSHVHLPHPRLRGEFGGGEVLVDRAGWAPHESAAPGDFVDGLWTYGGAGSAAGGEGFAIHAYAAERAMVDRTLANADADTMLVPVEGELLLVTELGHLRVAPGSVALIPRGMRFSVSPGEGGARGFMAESFSEPFRLPDRGPVGANGMADEKDFVGPTPFFEDRLTPGGQRLMKAGGKLWAASCDHSPFDVAAWQGNAVPWVYDLANFVPLSTVRADHADPSIYTVLSAPGLSAGRNNLDLVAFVPRWDATEGTFRPPFFHRNAATEFNGIIHTESNAGVFVQGAAFLTPLLTPHGPHADSVARSTSRDDASADRPLRRGGALSELWFQFESVRQMVLTPWAADGRREGWLSVWGAPRVYFDRDARDPWAERGSDGSKG